jgi:hypothetical protein
MIGAPEHFSRSVRMWNLALDGSGNPKLPGTIVVVAQVVAQS